MRLKVGTYTSEGETFLHLSDTIKATNSKSAGSINFYDALPLRCCEEGGRKTSMFSDFALAKNVEPRLQLVNSDNKRDLEQEEKLLEQPSEEYGMKIRNEWRISKTGASG